MCCDRKRMEEEKRKAVLSKIMGSGSGVRKKWSGVALLVLCTVMGAWTTWEPGWEASGTGSQSSNQVPCARLGGSATLRPQARFGGLTRWVKGMGWV